MTTCAGTWQWYHQFLSFSNSFQIDATIFEAAQRGSFQDIRYLLNNKKATPNDLDPQGIPALHYAALSNQDAIIKYLIDRGATVDYMAGDLKATALHWASR